MALPSSNIWECRTTGSDTANGGGFDPSVTSPGTDFSQQDAAQVSLSDLVIGATTTNLTSAAHPFGATHVGNTVQITGGTGFTTGFYSVRSVSGTTATMDRAVGTAASTGGVGGLGGALASPGMAAGAMAAGNTLWVRTGTYLVTSALANAAGGVIAFSTGNSGTAPKIISGYGSVRGDGGRPTLRASGISSVTLLTLSHNYHRIESLIFDGNSLSAVNGVSAGGQWNRVANCKALNCVTGLSVASGSGVTPNALLLCEATACTTGFAVNNGEALYCVSHGNTGNGFTPGADALPLLFCLAYGNGQDGFGNIGFSPFCVHCVASGNTRDGFRIAGGASGADQGFFINCLSAGNGGSGFNGNAGSYMTLLQNCAGYSNTSGNYSSSVFPVVNGFLSLTADPFVDKASGNFNLNNVGDAFGQTTGLTGVLAGRYLRGAGLGTFPGLPNTVGYPDVGAVQSQSSGGLRRIGFTGGIGG